jgi:hypothetical protein
MLIFLRDVSCDTGHIANGFVPITELVSAACLERFPAGK